ncbi:transcriptional regulator [Streptomyces canarius]
MHLDIHEMTTAPQIAALHDRTIDIGLLREPPTDETGLGFSTVLSEPFVAVLPSTHPLAPHRTVQPAQLAHLPSCCCPAR